jgi:hypothetical protein
MSKLLSYNTIKNAKSGELKELQKEVTGLVESKQFNSATLWETLDTACTSESFKRDFVANLKNLGVITDEQANKVRSYTQEEKEKMMVQFAAVKLDGSLDEQHQAKYEQALVDARQETNETDKIRVFSEKSGLKKNYAISTGSFLETTVLPLLDGLVRTSPSLSRVSMITERDYKKLIEFGSEVDSENLAKGEAGNEADDATRTGLTLNTVDNKIQASSRIIDRDLQTLDPAEWAYFIQRLVSRINYKMEYNLYYADGTSNSWQRGLKNSVGSDSTDMIGALTVDVSSGLTLIDKLKLMDKDLSKFISAQEEELYTYSVNRRLLSDLKLIKSALSGNYLLPDTGDLEINGHTFINSPAISDNDVFLSPLPFYTVMTATPDLNIISDQGLVEIKKGEILYVTKIHSDGSPRKAFKRTVGGTSDNNQDQNYHRYAKTA